MDKLRFLECGILRAEHEINFWKGRFMELETQFLSLELQKLEWVRAFEYCLVNYNGLAVEFRKKENECVAAEDRLKDLMIAKVDVEDELEEYKRKCDSLKERIACLEEDQKAMCTRENKAQERINQSSKESKKRGSDEIEKYVCQLETENKNLECGKRSVEDEIEVWKKRFAELDTQALRLKQVELEKGELQKELEAYITQCHGLHVELEEKNMEGVAIQDKLKDLQLRKIAVEDELKEYKTRCREMKEWIMGLEEDKKVITKKEKKSAQERITYLEKEIRNMESDEREKYIELKTENQDLESGKRRAEDDIEFWKKRYIKLETQFLSMKQVELEKVELEKGLVENRTKCNGLSVELEESKMERVLIESKLKDLLLTKIVVDDELKEFKTTCNRLKEQTMSLQEDQKIICEKEKRAHERITYLEEEIRNMESDEREKYIELKTENRDLECGKRRAEDDIEIWKKRYIKLETQFLSMKQVELEKVELQKGLVEYRTKCNGLSVELEESKMERVLIEGKLKDLLLTKIVVDDELKEFKTTCNRLKEKTMSLQEDQKIICEKEKRAQERITYLEAEIKSIKHYERDKYVDLKIENQDLECKKTSAENEIKIWMKRCSDLETEILGIKQVELEKAVVEQEFEILLTKYDELSMELNEKKVKCVAVEDDAHLPHLKIEEKMLNNSAFESCNYLSSFQGNRHVYVAGPPSIDMQSEPLANAMEEKKNSDLESKVDFGNRVKKQQVLMFERSSSEKLPQLEKASVRTTFGGIVNIGDGEDENKIAPEHTCHVRGKKTIHVSTNSTLKRSSANETSLTSKKCLKRPCSDRRGEEYHLSSTSKGVVRKQ